MRLTAMRLITLALLSAAAFDGAAQGTTPAASAPTLFAPGVIAGSADDGAAAFVPDGATVVFMRGTDSFSLMQSHRVSGGWSTPQVAPFSGLWRDLDPAMAPDGSFLLFVSNRPAAPGGPPLDGTFAGKRRPGQGMNLWRVARHGDRWGTPVRLADTVNSCPTTFAPSVSADGSVYFIGCDPADGSLRLLRAAWHDGRYLTPARVALGDEDIVIRDPAVAPDESFIVVSTKPVGSQQPYRLAIAFRQGARWGAPHDLGDAVNGGKHSMGAQLGPDHRTLYFYSDRRLPTPAAVPWNNGADHIWRVSLAPWLDARKSR